MASLHLRTEFFLDGGVDDEMGGDGVQGRSFNTLMQHAHSTDGLSVGSAGIDEAQDCRCLSTMKSPPSWEVSSPCES
ncbi:MAG: hypothetical protein MZV64_15530 [Ignavibacteriales bacterium]|nr:hypothetical protein [Ignavibacteriales bacterium]